MAQTVQRDGGLRHEAVAVQQQHEAVALQQVVQVLSAATHLHYTTAQIIRQLSGVLRNMSLETGGCAYWWLNPSPIHAGNVCHLDVSLRVKPGLQARL